MLMLWMSVRHFTVIHQIVILDISVWTKVVRWPNDRSTDVAVPGAYDAGVAKLWLLQYRWYWLAPKQPVLFVQGQSKCHFMLLQHLTFLLRSHITAERSHPSKHEIPHFHVGRRRKPAKSQLCAWRETLRLQDVSRFDNQRASHQAHSERLGVCATLILFKGWG